MANSIGYNPDVLSTLANLSSDEVFTPPEVAKAMLDLVPQELFKDPNTKFFDPATKSGIFLREIARRLIKGLREEIPDLQERLNHIYKNQIFGFAITELTGLMSRRSLYCSKHANGYYSVATAFDDSDGNIRFERIEHDWDSSGKCTFCGASKEQFDRGPELETHAYEFIHRKDLEELENMKFDLIISNPPYQIEDGGSGRSARPIYHLFVNQAKKLRPRYLVMITPSRWFTGGKGLNQFREEMFNDSHLIKLVDYQNAKDCFPNISLGGGVSYFLWDREVKADCEITNIINNTRNTMIRPLNEFPVFVRYNESVEIIKKVIKKRTNSIVDSLSSRNPFGLTTSVRGVDVENEGSVALYSSQGKSFIDKSQIPFGHENIYKWKVMISRVISEHAGEPDKSGKYKIISSIQLLGPGEVCTDSYIIGFPHENKEFVKNYLNYLQTKFVLFLILQALSSINLSRGNYEFVPMEDFSNENN